MAQGLHWGTPLKWARHARCLARCGFTPLVSRGKPFVACHTACCGKHQCSIAEQHINILVSMIVHSCSGLEVNVYWLNEVNVYWLTGFHTTGGPRGSEVAHRTCRSVRWSGGPRLCNEAPVGLRDRTNSASAIGQCAHCEHLGRVQDARGCFAAQGAWSRGLRRAVAHGHQRLCIPGATLPVAHHAHMHMRESDV